MTTELPTYAFEPVAFIRSESRYRFEAPRQAVYSGHEAFVAFVPDDRLRVAAEDLVGFERIWLIVCFHLNAGRERPWKPKVAPPVSADGKRYGVFATRSPHRPNPIGLSCVPLLGIERDGLRVGPCDLLDGTPVLDIKPYLPLADAFPEAAIGWRGAVDPRDAWRVESEPLFTAKAAWLRETGGLDAAEFCRVQLAYAPLDESRKRVAPCAEAPGVYVIGYRTWRIRFAADPDRRAVRLIDLISNYTVAELAPGTDDRYGDKALHRAFLSQWGERDG
ncbi:MAG: tRNA (N6-threonylcarbamoyladenosine(37)-N6)-methyltransferase TrmO [Kiritimatiellae bacterium]|nr:tRNA (N6-threonylcarbamoyladenosine(37)-N6)-methyltransferase TrmO [Kiritimatiellia bacterium]